jgi:membrane-bound lytic murein transglycosylase D
MNNNNDGLRRSSRPLALLALCAAVSACQSFGTGQEAPAAPPPVAAEVPLEPIVLPPLVYRDVVVEQDLLTRLRSRFAWEIKDDAAVERERAWYARNQSYLDRVFTRGDMYLYHIVGELETRGMPAELALLPIVESAFDPFAYSHGRAAGLWQIIPGTGKRLGLAQNWWFDGRRDVLESTRAALDYL